MDRYVIVAKSLRGLFVNISLYYDILIYLYNYNKQVYDLITYIVKVLLTQRENIVRGIGLLSSLSEIEPGFSYTRNQKALIFIIYIQIKYTKFLERIP